MNRRTTTLLIVVVVVIGGVYAITWWQRSRETQQMLADLQSRDHGVAMKAMTGLRDRTGAVSGRLIDFMEYPDAHVRWRAAMLLGTVESRASRESLTAALRDESADVRMQAAVSLGKLGARGASDRIAMLAGSDDEPVAVRVAALRALGYMRTGTHLGDVLALVSDRPEPTLEAETAEGTEEAAGEEAAEEEAAEEEAAEEEEDELAPVRLQGVSTAALLAAAAYTGEAEGEPTEVLGAVFELAKSTDAEMEPNDEVRQGACYALSDIAQMVPDETVREQVTRALLNAMDDETGDVRIAASHALRLVTPPTDMMEAVEETLERAAEDDHYWVRQAAGEVHGG